MLNSREWLDRLAPDTSQPLSKVRQLYLNLYNAITSGDIPDGTRLPSSRLLSQQLDIGRNTVIAAYEQLADEQLIHGNGRAGSRVNFPAIKSPSSTGNVLPTHTVQPITGCSSVDGKSVRSAALADLAPGMPDNSLFPREQWRRALVKASRLSATELGYQNGPLPELQQAIAKFLAIYRSLVVSPEQVIITSGTRQSLVLAAALYSQPGDIAWVESPGYPGAWEAFSALGLEMVAQPVDQYGMVIPGRAKERDPALIYSTPCFQYPTGAVLEAGRRRELLHLANQMNSVIFEDDYDSEFRDASEARPALASASSEDSTALVLHAGTFSKLIFPAARVAWLVVPESDIEKAHNLLRTIGGGHTAVAQATVTELLDNGTVAKHLQKARGVYAQRRNEIIRLLNRQSCAKDPRNSYWIGECQYHEYSKRRS